MPLPLTLTYPDIYKFATELATGFSICGLKSGLIILCLDIIALGKKLVVKDNMPVVGATVHSRPSVIADVVPPTIKLAVVLAETG